MTRLNLSVLVLLGVWTALLAPAAAQSGPPIDQFALVLIGDRVSPDAHRVALKTNPTRGNSWTALDEVRCRRTDGVLVFPGRSTARYYGQDRRENHLILRVTSTSNASQGRLRAVYALPPADEWTEAACTQLIRLVQSEPQTVRRHSLAVYERPRPAILTSDQPFVDHVEAPIRHRKPGVMEVEWLNILFQ